MDLYVCNTRSKRRFQHVSLFILYIYKYIQSEREFACNTTTLGERDQQREDEGGPLEPSVSASVNLIL